MAAPEDILANNIRRLVTKKGLSLPVLADFAEVSRSQLYDVASGRKSPTVEWLNRVAQALDVEVWQLLKP